ncbi:MAG: transposase [Chloroflexaceae bacterium]|nr:transposase [Chloroflexaceae bacterium]
MKERVDARLIAVRIPQAATDRRRRQLRESARKHGRQPSAERLALCNGNVFITNAPETLLTPKESVVMAHARWQIELVFKLWKSHGRIATWTARRPYAILCHTYAKLLAMLIQH